MHRLHANALLVCATLLATGCASNSASVDYSQHNLFVEDAPAEQPYIDVGPASFNASGAPWEACGAVVERTLEQARRESQRQIANGLVTVRWWNSDRREWEETPGCNSGFLNRSTEMKGRLIYIGKEKGKTREELKAEREKILADREEKSDSRESEEGSSWFRFSGDSERRPQAGGGVDEREVRKPVR